MLYTREIETKETYDVIVCGGGFSGFSAAYAAAREGKRVIIIDRGASLGGVGTQGLVNHILGVRALEEGRLEVCGSRQGQRGGRNVCRIAGNARRGS